MMKTKQDLLKDHAALQSMLTDAHERMVKIEHQLEAMPDDPKPVGRYKPKKGEEYWCIGGDGNIFSVKWMGSHSSEFRYALGNVYRTKEEAQAALDKQLATVRVLDRIAELNAEQGWVVDWGDSDQYKFYLAFCHQYEEIDRDFACRYTYLPDAYYGSEQTIETVIKEMADDCKLMLGVG